MQVTAGETDERWRASPSANRDPAKAWMRGHGVRFQPALGGTLHLGRTNAFFLGGGKALLNAYYAAAEQRGDSRALQRGGRRPEHLARRFRERNGDAGRRAGQVSRQGAGRGRRRIRIESGVVGRGLGRGGAELSHPRNAAQQRKDSQVAARKRRGIRWRPAQCHAIAIDARSPKFDGGIVTRLDCFPLGIVVNQNGRRFDDEGADLWPKRYAIWGRLDRLATRIRSRIRFSIRRCWAGSCPPYFLPCSAQSIPELAASLGLPVDETVCTVNRFNQAVVPGRFDHTVLDELPDRRACASEIALGAGDRYAAVLWLSAASRHHVHLSGSTRRMNRPRCG